MQLFHSGCTSFLHSFGHMRILHQCYNFGVLLLYWICCNGFLLLLHLMQWPWCPSKPMAFQWCPPPMDPKIALPLPWTLRPGSQNHDLVFLCKNFPHHFRLGVHQYIFDFDIIFKRDFNGVNTRGGALNFFSGRSVQSGFPKCGACELIFAPVFAFERGGL